MDRSFTTSRILNGVMVNETVNRSHWIWEWILLTICVLASSPAMADRQEILEQRCADGVALSCAEIASQLLESDDIAEKKKALELFKRSCELGNKVSCRNMGSIHYQGVLGVPDKKAALVGYKKACNMGDGKGCLWMGNFHYDGEVGDPDIRLAAEGFRLACDLGDGEGCNRLGFLLKDGELGDTDYAGAARAWERACELGVESACKVHPLRYWMALSAVVAILFFGIGLLARRISRGRVRLGFVIGFVSGFLIAATITYFVVSDWLDCVIVFGVSALGGYIGIVLQRMVEKIKISDPHAE